MTPKPRSTALCAFATGRYSMFWPGLASSAREHFHPTPIMHLVCFSDHYPPSPSPEHWVYVPALAWPKPTLYRYKWLAEHHRLLRQYDYLYLCDVDGLFVAHIGAEILGSLVATVHAGHSDRPKQALPHCRDTTSAAFVPENLRKAYYAGGFQGGTSRAYLHACLHMAVATQQDENRGVLATWHDESHWNAYLAKERPPDVALSVAYCASELDYKPTAKYLVLDKDHDGMRSFADGQHESPAVAGSHAAESL